MNEPFSVIVYGIPAPQGSKRFVGNGRIVESSKKVKPWREAVKAACRDELDRLGFTGDYLFGRGVPVEVRVVFEFPRPVSHYRTGKNAQLLRNGAPAFPAGRPDADKLARSLLDGLGEAHVFHDDAQVVYLLARKAYGPPGAYLTVREVKP